MKLIYGLNLAALLVISTLAGCGGSRSDLGSVTGTVTLNGAPLADARVEFSPKGEGGASSYGKTDSDGTFTMQATRAATGAALGENIVRITTADVLDQNGEEVVVPEKVPPMYNTKSQLSVDVQPGSNAFKFALEANEADVKQPDLADE